MAKPKRRLRSRNSSPLFTSARSTDMRPSLTIGIEEEYQTIDPETRDLRSHIDTEIMSQGKLLLKEQVKAEMHQSVVEVGTGICKHIKSAAVEVKALRKEIVNLARQNGL